MTRTVKIGGITIGGGNPIAVQSMTNTKTSDVSATLAQITRLMQAGCEIVRCAIPDKYALDGFAAVVADSPLPVVADIHFDYELAIAAAKVGAAKLRINPGNIGSMEKVDAIIQAAGEAGCAIRIGVNAGSLEKRFEDTNDLLEVKLAQSTLSFAEHFEKRGFSDIVLSAKASSVPVTVGAYRILAQQCDYPLHIGVTEAGTKTSGTVKSAVGLGALLLDGIGDTLRVSLTADPVDEIEIAYEILSSLDLRRRRAEMVSCPTCGRCEVDLITIAEEVNSRLTEIPQDLKIAVMGCVVNGPGEAREADYGIACGREVGMLFAGGIPLRKVAEKDIVDELFAEISGQS